MICFQETTNSGFGDRLRGIAHVLELSARHGETEVLYNDDAFRRSNAQHRETFPWRMTDLIRIEGLSFSYHPLPLPEAAHRIVFDSMQVCVSPSHPAFRAFGRLRPADPAVDDRLAALHLDRRWVGLHVRETDNRVISASHFDEDYEARALQNLRRAVPLYRRKRVFLAADNADSLRSWRARLEQAGFEVRTSGAGFDPGRLRQTGAEDMLVDFFALARCRQIIRTVPSEFSRFAAWIAGRPLEYTDLT